jgi:hypothetical protein
MIMNISFTYGKRLRAPPRPPAAGSGRNEVEACLSLVLGRSKPSCQVENNAVQRACSVKDEVAGYERKSVTLNSG